MTCLSSLTGCFYICLFYPSVIQIRPSPHIPTVNLSYLIISMTFLVFFPLPFDARKIILHVCSRKTLVPTPLVFSFIGMTSPCISFPHPTSISYFQSSSHKILGSARIFAFFLTISSESPNSRWIMTNKRIYHV